MDYLFESKQFECEGVESRAEDVGRPADLDLIGHDCRYGGSRSNPFCDAFSPIEHSNQFTVHAIEWN